MWRMDLLSCRRDELFKSFRIGMGHFDNKNVDAASTKRPRVNFPFFIYALADAQVIRDLPTKSALSWQIAFTTHFKVFLHSSSSIRGAPSRGLSHLCFPQGFVHPGLPAWTRCTETLDDVAI